MFKIVEQERKKWDLNSGSLACVCVLTILTLILLQFCLFAFVMHSVRYDPLVKVPCLVITLCLQLTFLCGHSFYIDGGAMRC